MNKTIIYWLLPFSLGVCLSLGYKVTNHIFFVFNKENMNNIEPGKERRKHSSQLSSNQILVKSNNLEYKKNEKEITQTLDFEKQETSIANPQEKLFELNSDIMSKNDIKESVEPKKNSLKETKTSLKKNSKVKMPQKFISSNSISYKTKEQDNLGNIMKELFETLPNP